MPKISKDYLITIGIAVIMLVFWFVFANIRWLIVLVSSVLLGLFISNLFIAYINNRVIRQFAFLNRQLRVHLDIPETRLFNFEWIYPSLQGQYLQRRIQVYTTTQTVLDRKREVPFTTISVNAPFGGRSFAIRPEALGKQFTKFFYNKKKVTEDRSFDRKFDVNSDDLEYIGGLLDDAVREILNEGILSRDSYLEFKNGVFSYTEQTVLNMGFKRRRFEKIILVMYMIAKKMEKGGRPAPLPEPKIEEVLAPELSELFEDEEFDDELDFDLDDDEMYEYEDDEEEDDGMGGRRLENEKEGSRQLDLFEEAGLPSSRKLDTSDEDLFRDGIEDGGKLSEEMSDGKKEKEKQKDQIPADSPKDDKNKSKPSIEPTIERLDEEDFGFDFGAGDDDFDIDLDDLDLDLDLDDEEYDDDDFDFDDLDLDFDDDEDYED
ncbi:MAG: hypothetical protein R3E32_26820 [Chitinophagales bacterium]